MNETDISEHPFNFVEHLKDNFKNEERGDQYSYYLVESVIRVCDELYKYCLLYMNPVLCHEMVLFLQSIAYDFVALNEWLKLKSVCKNLPPPARTSVSPSRVSHHIKKLSRSRSFRRAKSEPRLNKPYFATNEEKNENAPKCAGVNVSAPDFIPSYSPEYRTKNSLNHDMPESSEMYSLSNQNVESTPKSGLQSQFYSSSTDYHEDNEPLNNSPVNLSYSQNIIPPNFWQYSTQININPFQHPTLQLPHHYVPHVPHIHFPYSLYTNTISPGNIYPVGPVGNVITEQVQCSVNSGINHSFTYSTTDDCFQPFDIPKNEQSEHFRPSSSFSDNSDIEIIIDNTLNKNISHSNINTENGNLLCEISNNKLDPDEASLPVLASQVTENVYTVADKSEQHELPLEAITNPKEISDNISSPEPLPPDKIINESSVRVDPPITEQLKAPQDRRILGLGEDECQIQFPELKPINSHPFRRQKFRHRSSSKIKRNKPYVEITSTNNSTKNYNNKFNKTFSENITTEEKGSFPKLFKSQSIAEKQPIRASFNRRKNKTANSQYSSMPLKQNNTKIVKNMGEKLSTHISNYVDEENNDSDGWETVKVRSKWRDQTDFKQSRMYNKSFHSHSNIVSTPTGIRHNGKSFYDSKSLQYNNANLSHNLRSSVLDRSEGIIKSSSSDEELVAKFVEDKTSKGKHKHYQAGDIEKSFCVEKNIKKGRRNSSNTTHKANDNSENKQIESPSCVIKTDKIDPNEMYSAYMQYINNVDEENQDDESKHDKSILHPDAGEEIPQSVASLEQITDFVNRDPIRALEFQKKLVDEIKHQEDVKRKNEVKQQQAQKKRLQFLQCKTAKVREFVQKVEEVKAAQHQLALQRKSRIDLKLKKAEENRNMHLSIIKRKAHDEEEKLKEIAFINELEAQNRRHDSLALRQEHEERLQCLIEERQRRLEEKAAREAAVEERRRVLEAERQEKLEKLKEKRRRKQEIIDRKQQEREQERLEIAREKAREREERLQARQSAQLATVEELQKRIQQKQEESARRHVECIELIRQKAAEIGLRNTCETVPNVNVYKPLYLTGCCEETNEEFDIMPKIEDRWNQIYSAGGVKERMTSEEEQLKTEISNKDVDNQEKYKIHQKKRYKKVKSRMSIKGEKFIQSFTLQEIVLTGKDQILEKLLVKLKSLSPHHIYLWQNEEYLSIDHCLNEILIMLRVSPSLKDSFKQLKGYILINSILCTFNNCTHDKLSTSSLKCIIKIVNLCHLTYNENPENCLYIVFSNIITTVLESLKLSIKMLSSSNKPWELLTESLLKLSYITLESVNHITDDQIKTIPDFSLRMKDLITYIMYSGLITVTVDLFRASEIDEKFTHSSLIHPCISFFGTFLSARFITDELMNILKITDLLGTVPLLYEGLMQHITKDGSLPDYSLPIINLFLKLADLDLKSFQEILGSEGIALQWRGIASGLMMLCARRKYFGELLHCVIKTVGYFALHNKKNQTLIQSGKHPTVLQQLVKLPFQYFCNPKYMELLFPTLIACSFQNTTNKAIVENELNYSVLEKFISSDVGKRNKLIILLLEHQNNNSEM